MPLFNRISDQSAFFKGGRGIELGRMGVAKKVAVSVVILGCLVLGAAGCEMGKSANETSNASSQGGGSESMPRETIVFVDPTVQGHADGIWDVFSDSLREIARRRLQETGDRLSVFQIREETEMKTPQLQITNNIEPPGDSRFADREAMQRIRAEQETRELLRRADSMTTDFMGDQVRTEDGLSSDLIGSIEVLNEEQTMERRTTVFFLSDMFQASTDGRNFERSIPSTEAEAKEWAKEDARSLRGTIGPEQDSQDSCCMAGGGLMGVEIRMVPGRAADRDGIGEVKTYWTTLFSELGVESDSIYFN